jgi:hypothetical protein
LVNAKKRTLWGTEFDLVEVGLVENQVVSFVEDVLRRFAKPAIGRDAAEILRPLDGRKLREAERLAAFLGTEAKSKCAENRRGAGAASTAVQDGPESVGQWKPRFSERASDPQSSRTSQQVDLLLQSSDIDSDPSQMDSLITHLDQTSAVTVEGYSWSPGPGWVISVSITGPTPVVPLVLSMPEVERVADGRSTVVAPIDSPFNKWREGSTEPNRNPRQRLLVWLRGDGRTPQTAEV